MPHAFELRGAEREASRTHRRRWASRGRRAMNWFVGASFRAGYSRLAARLASSPRPCYACLIVESRSTTLPAPNATRLRSRCSTKPRRSVLRGLRCLVLSLIYDGRRYILRNTGTGPAANVRAIPPEQQGLVRELPHGISLLPGEGLQFTVSGAWGGQPVRRFA